MVAPPAGREQTLDRDAPPAYAVAVIGYTTSRDAIVDGRQVVISVRLRRLVCPVLSCPRQTFREQVPGLVKRYQRRTQRLASQLGSIVKELAGRAGARLSRVLTCGISRSTALRMLMRLPAPALRVPRVIGIDDFALKRLDPYRDHLRRRRVEDPAVPVTHLLREIKELGYTGSANLLVR